MSRHLKSTLREEAVKLNQNQSISAASHVAPAKTLGLEMDSWFR